MSSGPKRTRVTFHRLEGADDGYGNPVQAYSETPFLTIWAEILDERARERVQAGRLASEQAARAYVRFSREAAQVRVSDQMRASGRVYNVRGVVNVDERNKTLEFTLERGVA